MITVELNDGVKMVFRDGLSTYTEDGWIYICDDEAILSCFPKEGVKAILFDRAGKDTDGD